ncbi:OLC1v1020786C1 [Oldenlandia corymbosa var. corymbosa]|uniref:OLC1v1020786C1 n=1 Tax=Oldenlandia corymbosa var. corymbosa TaxID=529605 RepID=A0AAV1BWG9_OLDCO|nr:OLC1v1020786C1 [Oldenlandia corymbosa var. corymbosa]
MAHQRSHVPKFGNWDGDNVPYTAYFENARKEKGGTNTGHRIMNPNDPEENPDAFLFSATPESNHQIEGHRQHKSITSAESMSSDKGSSWNRHQRRKSENKKSNSENNYSNSFLQKSPSPGHTRLRGGSDLSDDMSYKSTSVPKFGAWDERDPKSAEGFTVIFNKVKEEKQIAAAKFPSAVQSQQIGNTNGEAETHKRKPRSKMRCCLF